MGLKHILVSGILTKINRGDGTIVLGDDGTVRALTKVVADLKVITVAQDKRIKALEAQVSAKQE